MHDILHSRFAVFSQFISHMWPEPSQSKVRCNLINKLSWVWNLIWFAGFLLSGTWSWSWAGDLWLDCQQLIWSSAPWQRQDCRIILAWVKIEQFKLKIVCIARYNEALLTQNNTKAHSNHCVTSFILFVLRWKRKLPRLTQPSREI